MTEKEYRSHPAVSRSELWRISESPEKFKYFKEHPPHSTPALEFGQLYHKMVLQPEEVWDEFAVAPNINRRTREGKNDYEAFLKTSKNKIIVTDEMVSQAMAMRDTLYSNDVCRELLTGEKETPYFWTDELTGEKCKCRCDIVYFRGGNAPLIVDMKTTTCAETNVFNHEIFKHGYHFQSAMYSEGVMKSLNLTHRPEFCIIAQEKKPPYSLNIINVTQDVMLAGEDKYRELLGIYHACKETGYWYGYNGPFDEINETYLPGYMSIGEREEEE